MINADKEIKVKWEKIVTTVPFYGDLNLGNGTMYRICSFMTNFTCQKNGLFLCIERKSSGWVFTRHNPIYPDYVAEKLMVQENVDIKIMTDWINAQLEKDDVPQFGEYDERYIIDNEPHGLIGEYKVNPLCPVIID